MSWPWPTCKLPKKRLKGHFQRALDCLLSLCIKLFDLFTRLLGPSLIPSTDDGVSYHTFDVLCTVSKRVALASKSSLEMIRRAIRCQYILALLRRDVRNLLVSERTPSSLDIENRCKSLLV
jgi:hypothetical protein